jgi:hypothetical protein
MARITEEMKRPAETVPAKKVESEAVAIPEELAHELSEHLPWMRRIEVARRDMTSPRDMFASDKVWTWKVPSHITDRVRFNWLSDWMIHNKPMMPGFVYDNWKPVTPEVMKDFEMTVFTEQRTAEGIPKVGLDAILYWCPEDLAQEMDKVMQRGAHVADSMKTEKRRMKEAFEGRMIGDVRTGTEEEIAEMETKQREELGSLLRSST